MSTTISLNVIQKKMVKEFQCSGCTCGYDPDGCGNFKPISDEYGFACVGWVPGTIIIPGGTVCLGLPTGFNKIGPMLSNRLNENRYIALYSSVDDLPPNPVSPTNIFSGKWNRLNLPVWAMEKDGYLFVKTYSPRKNLMSVIVIKDATMAIFDQCTDIPRPIDVAEFVDQID